MCSDWERKCDRMQMLMFPYEEEFVCALFVDIGLDFSIAQYMED